jgi:FAD/FMN-containing dehydrogenase
VNGRVPRAAHEGLDEALLVWNGVVARVPALVVRPSSAQAVAAAVRFARDHGMLLRTKGGRHDIVGAAVAERAVTLDLSRMREITVDPDACLAHVGPACPPSDLDRATQEHGLAVVLGFESEVGVADASDDLEEAEIVTADGLVRIANRDENTDLFWALRGGAGDVGVVTRLTFRLRKQAYAH